MKCKWNEKRECRLEKYLKREVEEGDCPFCLMVTFRGVAQVLMNILLEVGAGRRADEFEMCVGEILKFGEDSLEMTKALYPEIDELVSELRRQEAVSGEVEEVLKRLLKRNGVV
jgi:hypothetical protein